MTSFPDYAMNPNPGVENLLRNVLADVLPPAREADLLATTLCAVTRHRRRRMLQTRGAFVVGAAALATLALLLRTWTRSPARGQLADAWSASRTVAAANSVPVITSRPLSPPLVVETQPRLTPIVASGRTDLGWVETRDAAQHATVLSDDDLLALVVGRSAALVRNDGETRLVLAGGSGVLGRP